MARLIDHFDIPNETTINHRFHFHRVPIKQIDRRTTDSQPPAPIDPWSPAADRGHQA